MNKKLWKLTGEKQKFKLDYRRDGKLDISFVRLDRKFRQGGWNMNYPDYYLQSLGFNNPKKLYFTYADYSHRDGVRCLFIMATRLLRKMTNTELV